ncbi:hypothetical protein BRC85_09545 [Halobacteriales archaeon QS_1_69_70]|nr:MAG: hypothetical protein BRC85_09545 [Halobacteriales archaeon QS_1_69_70]
MSSEDLSSRRVQVEDYDLDDVLPVEGLAAIDPGTNVLISGGRMLGKDRLALELLAAGADDQAIAVTPDTAGSRLREDFASVAGRLDPLRVVDCTGASDSGSFDDTDDVKYVTSPGDLTGIGMGIVKCTREMGESVDDGLRLAVLSLSTLLRYSDPDRVFNFLHTVTGRVSAADYLGIATLDPGAHDPQDVNTLTSQFDVVVELREADEVGREARVLGHHESPRTWQPL